MWRFAGLVAGPAERTGPNAVRESGEDAENPWMEVVRGLGRMAPPDPELGPRWFIGSSLNFAENLLRYRDDEDAIVAWNESGRQRVLSYRALYLEVAGVAAAMRAHGIHA